MNLPEIIRLIAGLATGLSIIIVILYCVFGLFALFSTVFWIWSLVDCMTKEPSQGNDRLMWLLILIFTHFVGSLIYFFVRRPERRRMFGH